MNLRTINKETEVQETRVKEAVCGVIETSMGRLFVGQLGNELVGLYFDVQQGLVRLKREWPTVFWSQADDDVAHWSDGVERFLKKGELKKLSFLLKGTSFQLKVWKALLRIERGTVVTYSDIAKVIGCPLAVRAVGTAVGSNPISLFVPCHRVVPRSGGVGQYAWGSDIKKELLIGEGVFVSKELAPENALR